MYEGFSVLKMAEYYVLKIDEHSGGPLTALFKKLPKFIKNSLTEQSTMS